MNKIVITQVLLDSLDASTCEAARFFVDVPDGWSLAEPACTAGVNRIVASGLDVGWLVKRVGTPAAVADYTSAVAESDAAFELLKDEEVKVCDAEITNLYVESITRHPRRVREKRFTDGLDDERARVRAEARLVDVVRPAWLATAAVRVVAAWRVLSDPGNWREEIRPRVLIVKKGTP